MEIDLNEIKKVVEFLDKILEEDPPDIIDTDKLKWIRKIFKQLLQQSLEDFPLSDLHDILDLYSSKIKKLRKKDGVYKITIGAAGKVQTRLKTFSKEELLRAINNFSKEEWWMEHNAHRGVQWFFWSDDRIETFLNMRKEEILDPAINKLKKLIDKS